jgi:hypothetical protein
VKINIAKHLRAKVVKREVLAGYLSANLPKQNPAGIVKRAETITKF